MAGLKSVADKGLHTARMPAQLNGSVALMAAALSTVLLFARWSVADAAAAKVTLPLGAS
ncbi:hypothetical protein HaLaN_32300, partial [Haematococcus lacustris]